MRWSINGIPILGPDIVEYHIGETTILLNGAPRKHSHRSIVLSYRNLHASMLASLWQAVYDAARANRTVLLSYYDQDGVWRTSPARPRIPTVGSLRGVEGVDIVLTFFLDPNVDVEFVGIPPAPAPSIGEQPPPDPRRFLVNQLAMVGASLALQAGTPSVAGVTANRDVVGVLLDVTAGTPTLNPIFPPSPAGAILELMAGVFSIADSIVTLSLNGATIVVAAGTADFGEPGIRPDETTLDLIVGAFAIENQPGAIDPVGGVLDLNAGTPFVEGYVDIEWGDVIVYLLAGTPGASNE